MAVCTRFDEVAHALMEDIIGPEGRARFLRQGSAVQDFLHPDRVVSGRGEREAGPLSLTKLTTAEMITYASNAAGGGEPRR
jgi:UDP-glucose 6-dehydrogenase